MELGTATAAPGELDTGHLEVATLPTEITERLPVAIANGAASGPELWVTASIHGDEANGLAVAQDILRDDLVDNLAGAVVVLPNLNPAGLRRNERRPYYGGDPNRRFPDPEADPDSPKSVVELINQQVFDAFAGAADALIDLHTANISSVPFNIRHRVLYGERRDEATARTLAAEQERLMEAFGLPIVRQYDEYLSKDRHRTTTGAALNAAGIPAMTVELGQHSVVNDEIVAAGVAGCYRVMVAMDMLDAVPIKIGQRDPDYRSPVSFPVKRTDGPYTDTPGIVRHHLEPGEAFSAGDAFADIVTSHGTQKTTIEVERDGYLISRCIGAATYTNDELGNVVVRDRGDVVIDREGAN